MTDAHREALIDDAIERAPRAIVVAQLGNVAAVLAFRLATLRALPP